MRVEHKKPFNSVGIAEILDRPKGFSNRFALYGNIVHLSAILENIHLLVQCIRCEPLGEHLFIEHVLYFLISHENEQRLYFLTRSSHT